MNELRNLTRVNSINNNQSMRKLYLAINCKGHLTILQKLHDREAGVKILNVEGN